MAARACSLACIAARVRARVGRDGYVDAGQGRGAWLCLDRVSLPA